MATHKPIEHEAEANTESGHRGAGLPPGSLDFVVDLAREAGGILREGHRRGPQEVRSKGTNVDLVTEVDLASEHLIVNSLRRRFPQDEVYAEESLGTLPEQGRVWVADPLDGTTNFAHGFPVFAVSIALIADGQPILGVTYDPLREEMFWSVRGQGAWRNGHPLRVSRTTEIGQSLLATGFPYDRATNPDNNLAEFSYFMPRTRGVRRAGAAALDMAWLAAGRLDGYWEQGFQVWDAAAGVLMIEEAGGRVTTYSGRAWQPHMRNMVASNGVPALHRELLEGLACARNSRPGLGEV